MASGLIFSRSWTLFITSELLSTLFSIMKHQNIKAAAVQPHLTKIQAAGH